MDRPYEYNIATAAAPQAIRMTPPPKQPVYDNDPTRNVSPIEGVETRLLTALVALALLVMLASTVLVFVRR